MGRGTRLGADALYVVSRSATICNLLAPHCGPSVLIYHSCMYNLKDSRVVWFLEFLNFWGFEVMVYVTRAIHPIFSIGTGFGRRQFSRRMSRSLQAICFLIFHLILSAPNPEGTTICSCQALDQRVIFGSAPPAQINLTLVYQFIRKKIGVKYRTAFCLSFFWMTKYRSNDRDHKV